MRTGVSLIVAAAVAVMAGCVGVTDEATFLDNKRLYIKNAEGQVKAGNWNNARRTYTLALSNATWAEDKPQELATLNYQVGRANGVTCRYELAEQHLNQAMELDKQSSGPSYRSTIELGRLNLAQGKAPEAAGYFERALAEMDKTGVEKRDPVGLAEALDDYANALAKAGKDATAAVTRAADLHKKHAGTSAVTARAPYGTQCEEPKS
jgi:tetratricopeptide (TPR) repeat protein